RGNKSDRRTDIKAGRYVGVGLGVRPGRQHTKMHAYFQDIDTGTVVAVKRIFSDPDPDSGEAPRSVDHLATHGLARGVTLGNAAMSQMTLASGKRTPTDELVLPRGAGKLTTNPQTYQWEQLVPPLAIDDFAVASQRFESLPPEWLRPRRDTENLHVVKVKEVSQVEFDVVHQQLTAAVVDEHGRQARLAFPYYQRAERGFGQLMLTLQQRGKEVCYICGRVRLAKQQLEIEPITVVLESADGTRQAVSAWLGGGNQETSEPVVKTDSQSPSESVIAEFLAGLAQQCGEVLITGLHQANPEPWRELARTADHLGFVRLAEPIRQLTSELTARADQLRWQATAAAKATGQLCMLSRIIE
ncbi:MAG: hypothetical protein MI861_03555, partial [Pirellulales bacterium]|nr:hypothetical protein [Pirellulales bacterium]